MQSSTAHRAAIGSARVTDVGAGALMTLFTGASPGVSTAATGTQLVQWTGGTPFGVEAAGVLTATVPTTASVASAAPSAAGPYYLRVGPTAGGKFDFTAGASQTAVTNATTATGSNVFNFAASPTLRAGQLAQGTNIPANSMVLSTTSTTVTLSKAATGAVASGATITFTFEFALQNENIASGQQVTFSSLTITESDA